MFFSLLGLHSDHHLFQACEQLVLLRVFIAVAPMSVATEPEFVRYRCAVDRAEVKRTVEQIGQLNLKKWFSKS